MFCLPTHSPRKYRGKYPTRINSWGYSNSASQQALGKFLGITRPVHIELNDGRRYIADTSELKTGEVKLGVDLDDLFVIPATIIALTQERYDEMLGRVREIRGY